MQNKNKGALIAVPFIVLIVLALMFIVLHGFLKVEKNIKKVTRFVEGDPLKNYFYYSPHFLYAFLMDDLCCEKLELNCINHYDLLERGKDEDIEQCWNIYLKRLNCCNAFISKAALKIIEGEKSKEFIYKELCESEECYGSSLYESLEEVSFNSNDLFVKVKVEYYVK